MEALLDYLGCGQRPAFAIGGRTVRAEQRKNPSLDCPAAPRCETGMEQQWVEPGRAQRLGGLNRVLDRLAHPCDCPAGPRGIDNECYSLPRIGNPLDGNLGRQSRRHREGVGRDSASRYARCQRVLGSIIGDRRRTKSVQKSRL